MRRTVLIAMIAAALAVVPGCSYKIYVRGVQDLDAGSVQPETGLHIQFNEDDDKKEGDEALAAKIENVLEEKGYSIVPESEAVAYLFFEYEMEDLVKRKYLHPSPSAATGISTIASEGPFIHRLNVSVVNAGSYLEAGKTQADVIWAGGAVLDTTSLRSPKTVDLLVVALFDHFPDETERTLKVGMRLSDSRAAKLRAATE